MKEKKSDKCNMFLTLRGNMESYSNPLIKINEEDGFSSVFCQPHIFLVDKRK